MDQFIDIGAFESGFEKPDVASEGLDETMHAMVHPNPFTELLNVETADLVQHIDLFDITGKVLASFINSRLAIINFVSLKV